MVIEYINKFKFKTLGERYRISIDDNAIRDLKISDTETLARQTRNYMTLSFLTYILKETYDDKKKPSSWFPKFFERIKDGYLLAVIDCDNINVSKAINDKYLVFEPSLENVERLLNNIDVTFLNFPNINSQTIIKLQCNFAYLLLNKCFALKEYTDKGTGKLNQIEKPIDTSTCPQIFNPVFYDDGTGALTFRQLSKNQKIFLYYALKRSADIFKFNLNTPYSLYCVEEEFTAYRIQNDLKIKTKFNEKEFYEDIKKLEGKRFAFKSGDVTTRTNLIGNVYENLRTHRHTYEISTDFLRNKLLIARYLERYYSVEEKTGKTMTDLFNSKLDFNLLIACNEYINRWNVVKDNKKHNWFTFTKFAADYGLDCSDMRVFKQKIKRYFAELGHDVKVESRTGKRSDNFQLESILQINQTESKK